MRNIFSFLTSALVLLAVTVACHPSEITNPDNPDPKGKSEITITASIIQTRVSYDCSGLGEVKQHWEENDVLFGYYHQKDTDPSTSNRIVFQVEKVDSGTGIATLKVLSPEKWIDTAADETKVDLVYTGDDDIANLPFSASGIDVDLSGQSLDRVPGCMHAQAALQEDEDGNKSLEFNFQNDCALIEIDSLTGFVEDWPGGSEISLDLSSVHITHLLLGGSYSFSNGELVFDSDEDSLEDDYAIELESGWAVRKDGDVSGPNGEKILIAVAPNPVEKEINVSAEKTSEMGTIQYPSYTYGKRSLAGGLCYVISAQPVVAKTADGQCFKSVSAAFDHAEALSSQGYNTASKNVVTLIKKEIDGFGEQTASPAHNEQIEIDYNVTLDLNGCTLSLDGVEGFYVPTNLYTPATFTITDSNGLNDDDKYEGKIKSTSISPIIFNLGNVKIDGGEFYYTFSDKNSYEHCCMIDNEGSLTIGNDSYLQVDGTTPNNGFMYFLISSTGTLTVNSGSLKANDVLNTIGNLGGTVTIHGGEVYSDLNVALYSDSGSTTTIDGKDALIHSEAPDNQAIVITSDKTTKLTSFTMSAGKAEGAFSAVMIDGNVKANISGGYFKSESYHTLCVFNESDSKELNPSCEITGGVIHNTKSTSASTNSAVYCFTRVKSDDGINNLVVKWAKGNDGDCTGLQQPILFSNKEYPIEAKYFSTYNNFAQIKVSGGYLYSGNTSSTSRYFYDERDKSTDSYYCLTIPANSYFFTNTNALYVNARKTLANYTQNDGNSAASTTKSVDKFKDLIGSLSFTFCISTSSVSAPGEMSDYQHESLE